MVGLCPLGRPHLCAWIQVQTTEPVHRTTFRHVMWEWWHPALCSPHFYPGCF